MAIPRILPINSVEYIHYPSYFKEYALLITGELFCPSAKSKGVRFVSAKLEANQTIAKGKEIIMNHNTNKIDEYKNLLNYNYQLKK